MIKKWYNTTVGDYVLMEKTGSISQFKTWWNILPSFLFIKQIAKIVNQINTELSSKKVTDEEEVNKYKLSSLNKINLLELHLQYVYFVLVNQIELEQILKKVGNKIKTKYKGIDIEKLKESIKVIEEITGIKIEGEPLKKMQEVRDEIDFRKDKYKENFYVKPNPEESKKISLLEFAGKYVAYMGGEIDRVSKMLIIDLINTKTLADEKFKAEQEQYNKLKNGSVR
jgi:hypothetical protein